MSTEDQQVNEAAKGIIKEFVVKKMLLLLADPDCERKVREDKEVLDKLGIKLATQDLQPFVAAINESALIDYEGQCLGDGLRIQGCFNILAALFAETPVLNYYNRFAGLKLGVNNLSDFNYVATALKILDPANWSGGPLNEETQQAIKNIYFHSIINASISGEDKVSNLDTLQHALGISVSEAEKTELGRYLKQNIMGLVELIDQMSKTSFGAQPLPAKEPSSGGVVIGFPTKLAMPEAKEKKKFLGFLNKK